MMQQASGSDRPRFRQDLVAEPIDEQGAKFIDVMDPDSGNVFRFYEVEFSIACAMDGERDVAGLVKWAQEELGVTPSVNEVRTVIATLGDLGYLDHGAGAAVPLASGVVVGTQPKQDLSSEVVLGSAGTNVRAAEPLPKAPELDLGAAGTTTPARPRAPVEEVALGAPGRVEPPATAKAPDMSLDLSDHIAVKPADVKEAVRQSKVMQAVDVHPDLLDEVSAPRTVEKPAAKPRVTPPAIATQPSPPPATPVPAPAAPPPVVAPTPIPAVTKPAAPKAPAAPAQPTPTPTPAPAAKPAVLDAQAKPAERVKPAVELPSVPEKQPVAPPAPRSGVSPVLIVAVILVVAGAIGFFVWKYMIDRTNTADQSATSTTVQPTNPVPPRSEPPPEPPKPPAVTAKITMEPASPKTLLSMFGGSIEWIEATDKDVKSGDIVMKLVGLKQLEATIATLQKDADKRAAEVEAIRKARDAAQAAGNAAAQKTEQARLDEREDVLSKKQQFLSDKKDELEQFVVRVNLDGKFTPTAKVGQKLPENSPIATLAPAPGPSATFKVPEGTKMDIGTTVSLEILGGPKEASAKLLTCVVAEWSPGSMRASCPAGPDVIAGAEVSWQLP